eukprot:gene6288-6935_t
MDIHFASETEKKVVLITGCSTGIGFSVALAFAQHPQYSVWATMRNPAKSNFPADLKNLKVIALDVTSDESVASAVSHILAVDQKIDIVVNNAGYGLAGMLETVTVEESKAVFEVNVWGVMRVLQAVLPSMRQHRSGYIINISSTSGIRGIPCFEIYTSSKFALEGMTDSLRYSLAPFNIAITNINAGPVRTAFTDRFGNADLGGKGTRVLDDAGNADYLNRFTDAMVDTLNRRMAAPSAQSSEEIGTLLVNLAELQSKAKHVTDVPFNVGSNHDSQKVIEEVRKHPTGWGGIFTNVLQSLPPLPSHQNDEL